jgi:hypothetical protein
VFVAQRARLTVRSGDHRDVLESEFLFQFQDLVLAFLDAFACSAAVVFRSVIVVV